MARNAEFDELEWIRDQLHIEQQDWADAMGVDRPLRLCNRSCTHAVGVRTVLILTYAEQLKMLASEEKVDLLDACRHAGVPTSTYYRSIEGDKHLRQSTAEAIANAIRDLSAR